MNLCPNETKLTNVEGDIVKNLYWQIYRNGPFFFNILLGVLFGNSYLNIGLNMFLSLKFQ